MKERDFSLAEKIAKLPDQAWVTAEEVSALTGIGLTTIRQRKVALPPADSRFTIRRWSMGAIRKWMKEGENASQSKTDRGAAVASIARSSSPSTKGER
ncbi:hypothetical protein ACIPEN_14050 [Herbaspirillum chlorophenolicum]|uniref:Helix-turn-helix domain-containing protein n=1 Tax=Herbaspirillum chlorophenolicum TaxID=211589 RepID=A0ABW8F0X3_9BURK